MLVIIDENISNDHWQLQMSKNIKVKEQMQMT
jgi:hypothetical protein